MKPPKKICFEYVDERRAEIGEWFLVTDSAFTDHNFNFVESKHGTLYPVFVYRRVE